jgi:hypothetical protein
MSAEAIALFAATSASALRKLNYYFVSQRTEFAQKKRAQKDIKRKSLLYFFAYFFVQLVPPIFVPLYAARQHFLKLKIDKGKF